MTATDHGSAGAYTNHGCRCPECCEAHTVACANSRRARYAARVLHDGVWIAPLPDEHHGRPTTYKNHGCRCRRCTDAVRASQRTGRAAS